MGETASKFLLKIYAHSLNSYRRCSSVEVISQLLINLKLDPMKISALFCSFLFLGFAAQTQTTTLEPGNTAPGFNLKNVDEKMISPESYPDARGFIVVFTANTCPYAIAYEDRLIALDKKFAPQGYPVIAINPNSPEVSSGDSYKKMQEKAKTKGFSFPYLYDKGQVVTGQYGAQVTPHIFLLKKNGASLQVMYTGALDNDTQNRNPDKILYVENAIAEIEAGKAVSKPSTKAIGCTVKRSAVN